MGMNMKRGLAVAGGLLTSLTLIACGSDEESVKPTMVSLAVELLIIIKF